MIFTHEGYNLWPSSQENASTLLTILFLTHFLYIVLKRHGP
jgi:hypothetical protein